MAPDERLLMSGRELERLEVIQRVEDRRLIEIVEIDTSTPASLSAFTELLTELTAQNAESIAEHATKIADAARGAEALAETVQLLDPLIKAARDAYPETDERHTSLNELAARIRNLVPNLNAAGAQANEAATATFASVVIPNASVANEHVVPVLLDAGATLDIAVRYAQTLLDHETRERTLADLRAISEAAVPMRDTALLAAENIQSLGVLSTLDIARALQSADAVLIINPRKTTAIDFRSLFPPTALINAKNGSGAEITFAGEELIASALASINNPNNPAGSILTAEDLQRLSDLVVRHDLLLISDEVYEHIVFTDPHSSEDRKSVCRERV